MANIEEKHFIGYISKPANLVGIVALLRPFPGSVKAIITAKGLDGKSAYDLAVDAGFEGTLEDFITPEIINMKFGWRLVATADRFSIEVNDGNQWVERVFATKAIG